MSATQDSPATLLPERARAYAITAHRDQRYGEHPYTYHLDAVADIVRRAWPESEQALAVAYLHDVLEDTDVPASWMAAEFGWAIAWQVDCLTDPVGATRTERKSLLHARLREAGGFYRIALLVKSADRLANVRECVKNDPQRLATYRDEHAAFRAACFREGLCDEIWAELDGLLRERSKETT
jgi:guanosine-3',5'-bis(diphosphate) 3'-pyrophosphohydrolase